MTLNVNNVYDKIDVDFAYESFQKHVLLCFDLAFPLSAIKHPHIKYKQPWFSSGVLTKL